MFLLRALVYKKRGLSPDNPIFLLNLKSNTMKNTVQRYGIFLILPNNSARKYVLQHIFVRFAISVLQK